MITKIYNNEIEIANLKFHQSIKLNSIECENYKSEFWVTRVFKGVIYEQRIFSYSGKSLSTTSQFIEITKHELDKEKVKKEQENK